MGWLDAFGVRTCMAVSPGAPLLDLGYQMMTCDGWRVLGESGAQGGPGDRTLKLGIGERLNVQVRDVVADAPDRGVCPRGIHAIREENDEQVAIRVEPQ